MATVEVASLEPDFRADGTAKYVVRGYGKWNRLQMVANARPTSR